MHSCPEATGLAALPGLGSSSLLAAMFYNLISYLSFFIYQIFVQKVMAQI